MGVLDYVLLNYIGYCAVGHSVYLGDVKTVLTGAVVLLTVLRVKNT